ncbi:hypothetical protein L7F22_005046 [Adiantum nelumboides]|nr:hypothetical protein [Adiantum nelumboides]
MEPSSKKVGAAFSDDSSSSDEKGEFSYKNFHFRPKKKRRHDAGRRYARGVLYDSTVGITCHFCRQKTTRKHVYCRNCVLPLCGSCLRNRHGEVLELEVADDNWLCPRCRGGCGPGCKNCCNCTFCRKKQGLRPPKFAPRELSARGFDNVHDYLIHLETRESADIIWARKAGKGWCSSYEKKSANLSQESQQKMWGTSKESVDGSRTTAMSMCQEGIDAEHEENPMRSSHQGAASCENEKEKPLKVLQQQTKNADGNNNVNVAQSERPMASKDGHQVANLERKSESVMGAVDKNVTSLGFTSHSKVELFIPNQFRSRSEFKEKLQAKLAEPFDDQELKTLWAAITCRRPVNKTSETNPGMPLLTAKQLGHSYIHHHQDLAKKYTAVGEPEVKLKLLRSFFFWLEHGSMEGSFKPWIESAADEECLELNGPDCQVLGELLNLEKEHPKLKGSWHLECEEDIKPDIKSCLDSLSSQSKLQSKMIFKWNEEDIKPKVEELKNWRSSIQRPPGT